MIVGLTMFHPSNFVIFHSYAGLPEGSSIGSLSETSKNRPRPGRHILQRQVELHRLRPAAWRVYLAASQETAGAEHGPGSDPETAGGPPKMLGEASNPGISDDGSFTWMMKH